MTSDDLYALFRSDVVDATAPYLWTETEVWNYMNDAYKLFVRKMGGIPDNTSVSTKVLRASVQAGGTGNLGDGAGVVVVGTTGTGTKFRASVTIASNAIVSVQSISLAGEYTVNPTDVTAEPVTYVSGAVSGTTLTGAALAVVMSLPITAVPIVAGQATSDVSPLILRFTGAYLASTDDELTITNEADLQKFVSTDYGYVASATRDTLSGKVLYMVTGADRNAVRGKVRWVRVPEVDDTARVSVYRLPRDVITTGFDFDVDGEIGTEHIEYLMLWMKARAYGKQDAETFNKTARDDNEAKFNEYCATALSEWRRYKSHSMQVAYGGI